MTWAYEAYMGGEPTRVIVAKTGYPPHVIRKFIFGSKFPRSRVSSVESKDGWYYRQYRENIEAVAANKLEIIEELVYKGLGLTKLSFEAIQLKVKEGAVLSPTDLGQLVNATQKLHSMGKLEAGESTQNVHVQVDCTLDGIKRLMAEARDAELDFIEADVTKLEILGEKKRKYQDD